MFHVPFITCEFCFVVPFSSFYENGVCSSDEMKSIFARMAGKCAVFLFIASAIYE